MANSKAQRLSDMGTSDLVQELDSSQHELLNLRFQLATHQNSNYAQIRILKREIARTKTILRERQLAEGGA